MQKKTNKQHNKKTTQDDNNSDWHIYKENNDYCRILLMSIPRRGRTNVQSISVWFNGFFLFSNYIYNIYMIQWCPYCSQEPLYGVNTLIFSIFTLSSSESARKISNVCPYPQPTDWMYPPYRVFTSWGVVDDLALSSP